MKCCERCMSELGYCLRDELRASGANVECEDYLLEVIENEEVSKSDS